MNKISRRVNTLLGDSLTPMMVVLCTIIALICSWILLSDTPRLFAPSTVEGLVANPTLSLTTPVAPTTPADPWLCDYHVKTAYNACAESYEQHAVMSIGQLKNVISNGYRCLDFELHPIGGEPMVAAGGEITYFESDNYISFSSVMATIKDFAFNSGTISGDAQGPLFINLRPKIKIAKSTQPQGLTQTQAVAILNKVLEQIQQTVGVGNNDRLFHGSENNDPITSSSPLTSPRTSSSPLTSPRTSSLSGAEGKVIIMVDATNSDVGTALGASNLNEYANIVWGNEPTAPRALTYGGLEGTDDFNARNQFAIIYPGTTHKVGISKSRGCQFIAMRAGEDDKFLAEYNTFFGTDTLKTRGGSFVLKPSDMQHEPALTATRPSGEQVERERRAISSGTGAITDVGKAFTVL